MAKICAVVLNSVSRDARVLKEAESLVAAGHEISIVGIADKHFPAPNEVTPTGIRIYRVELAKVRTAISFLLKACVTVPAIVVLLMLAAFPPSVSQTFLGLAVAVIGLGLFSIRRFFIQISHSGLLGVLSNDSPPKLSLYHRARSRIGEMLWFWLRLWPLASVALRLSPDVVHCHDIHTLPLGVLMKKRAKCRLVYDAHEIYEEIAQGNAADSRRCRRLHRFCQRFIDGFITINDSIAAWYARNYPRLPTATIIMNATRHREFSALYDGRLHAAADLSADAKILLYQGGYSTHRGLETLVKSARYLPVSWFLVMMGWGKNEAALRAIASEVNAITLQTLGHAAVRFIPPAPQAELALWTSGATIGVIPYENTGLNHWFCTPNKLWEYPNANVPLLVSPFPEMRRQIEQYGHGWLLPEELSPETIAIAVAALNDSDIATARQKTFRFMSANHWGIYEARLFQLYTEICGPTVSQGS